MHIIIENGDYRCSNLGDVAMLQVAVSRLKWLWPEATLHVLTVDPIALAFHCPGTQPLSALGRDLWFTDQLILGRFHQFLPEQVSLRLSGFKRVCELRWPNLVGPMILLRLKLRESVAGVQELRAFLEMMQRTDLVVVCGSGGFTDHCRPWNMAALNSLEAAIHHKIPSAMMGQGMGPLSDSVVLDRSRRILPAVDLITLRGSRGGPSLLESLGVSPSRVLTTGDEAIELAYESRSKEPGRAIGVNLRVSSNAEVEGILIDKIRPVLQDFARRHDAPLLPVPIAFHRSARDHLTIEQLLQGYDDHTDGGRSLDTTLKVIQQAGRCRIVVSGAYHAAVFALSQGIPVVCLAKSDYYVKKFQGLEDLFGSGCDTVSLNDTNLSEKLAVAIEKAWESADAVRQPLQQAALRQISSSRSAYERLKEIVSSHRDRRQAN